MNGLELAVLAVTIAFALGALLLIAIVVLKLLHRHRMQAHEVRRARYLVMLSTHLASPGSIPELSVKEAEDDAFIDAVIDVRNTVIGPSVDALDGIVDKSGLIKLQATRLRARWPLGKRLRAVVSLAEIGDSQASRLLMHHLSDPEPEIRVQCARGLARMRHTPAIDSILDRFSTESPWVRSRFAEALALFGRDAVWPLVAFIRVNHRHRDIMGVPEAVRVLERIGDGEVGPALSELLYTVEDLEVRLAIIEALGEVGGPLSLRPLRRMFLSDDWRVRAKTARAFAEIGDPSVLPILATGLADPSWWTRRNSAASLAALPGGIDFLYQAMRSADRFARDAAAEALADCGELIAARDRLERGEATERDHDLIGHMEEPGLVVA